MVRPARARGIAGAVLAAVSLAAPVGAQDDLRKPKVDIVSVVGCATHPDAQTWMLTRASEAAVVTTPYSSRKDVTEANARALGAAQYRLVGTNEFVTTEELLSDKQRASFTTAESANTTGALKAGRKVFVKGLLIPAPQEKRLNLLSVQPLADTCP